MNAETQFEHLNRHKYFVKSLQGINVAVHHWMYNVCSHALPNRDVYIKGINFELKEESLPAVISFCILPHYPGSKDTNVVVFRFPDGGDIDRHKTAMGVYAAPSKLPDGYYVGDNMYIVLAEQGALSAAAHFTAYENRSEVIPCEIVKEMIFPRMMSFHSEDEDDYVSVNSVQLPGNFNGTLDQLAQQIIETPL